MNSLEPVFRARRASAGDSSYVPSCFKGWHGATSKFTHSVTSLFEDSSMTKHTLHRTAPLKHFHLLTLQLSKHKVPTTQLATQRRKDKLVKQIAAYQHHFEMRAEVLSSENKLAYMEQAAGLIQRTVRGFLARRHTEPVNDTQLLIALHINRLQLHLQALSNSAEFCFIAVGLSRANVRHT